MVPDYIASVLADSPSAFWELQDAGDFPQDSSGNAKHMDSKSVVTSLTYRESLGPGSSFRPFLSRASLWRSTDTVLTATDNITMEIWIGGYSSDSSFLEVFFIGNVSGATNPNALGNNGWGLAATNLARPIIRTLNGGVLATSTTSTTLFSSGAGNSMQHVVVVRRSGTWELWINGIQDTSIGTFTSTPGAYTGAGQVVYLGQGNATSMSFRPAFAALYPVALSSARIGAHYDAMVHTWNTAYVELDESTDPVLPGTFTTCDARQGIVPDRPYHFAEYEELSWLTTGDADIAYADGAGVSIFP